VHANLDVEPIAAHNCGCRAQATLVRQGANDRQELLAHRRGRRSEAPPVYPDLDNLPDRPGQLFVKLVQGGVHPAFAGVGKHRFENCYRHSVCLDQHRTAHRQHGVKSWGRRVQRNQQVRCRKGQGDPGSRGTERRLPDGCHCTQCRAANRAEERHRTDALRNGVWEPLVDAAPAREHLQLLRQH